MNQQAGNERPATETTEDDAIDHTIRAKAASEGLRLRLYKAARDDQSVEHIVEFCTGFVSWEFVTLYLDQLRVDQGRPTQSDVECAGRGIQRWDDLRSYIALDDQDITRAICITARWYNSGFPEDESECIDHSFYVALPGGGRGDLIPDSVIEKQTMELSVVGASNQFCRGMGRLMVALCLRYCDQLNSKGRNYTHIMVTLGRKNGEFNHRFAGILHDLGFLPVLVYNPNSQRVRCGGDLLAAMVLVRDDNDVFLSLDRLTSNIIFYKPPPSLRPGGEAGDNSILNEQTMPWLNPDNNPQDRKISPYAARGYLTCGKFDPSVFDEDADPLLAPVPSLGGAARIKKRISPWSRHEGPAKSCGRFHHPPLCQCHLAHLHGGGAKPGMPKPASSPRLAKKSPALSGISLGAIVKKRPTVPAKKGACGRNGHRPDCRCHLKHRQMQSPDIMPKKKPKTYSPAIKPEAAGLLTAPAPVDDTKNPFRPSYASGGRASWTSTCAALTSSSYSSQQPVPKIETAISSPPMAPKPQPTASSYGGAAPDFSKNATSCGRFHHPPGCQCHVKHKMVNALMIHANKRSPVANNPPPATVLKMEEPELM